ncbi:hypothetical protein BJ971_005382 [Actinoplanes digitatis]|uniref:Uncharacterized protein n=1 Tax=Actinoplanes digitatis TaxID=1868 RepID=A0A7W7MS03_9ACTN|nr:hypothetical protein [Actinoplanes digitatis]
MAGSGLNFRLAPLFYVVNVQGATKDYAANFADQIHAPN